jgi:hypothetical protein
MSIADLALIAGRTYPARRRTQNLGNVTLEPNGGQVPWHNQEQEEVDFISEGTGADPSRLPARTNTRLQFCDLEARRSASR